MTPLIGLIISSPESLGTHPDLEVETVAKAVAATGVGVRVIPWTAEVDWSEFSALVLKSPWDYSMRSHEFGCWLAAVETETTVLNHPDIVRWSADKRYLRELISAGINATSFVTAQSAAEARAALGRCASSLVVIKPTVSAGSRNTGLFETDDPKALDLVERIVRLGKTAMIMEALSDVAEEGEHGLIYFGGNYSHCGRKAPILARGGDYLGGIYTETIESAVPGEDEIELGMRCLGVATDLAVSRGVPSAWARPLYARIDIARDNRGEPCVLEAELFEPNYFTRLDPGAAARFAEALCRQLNFNETAS